MYVYAYVAIQIWLSTYLLLMQTYSILLLEWNFVSDVLLVALFYWYNWKQMAKIK